MFDHSDAGELTETAAKAHCWARVAETALGELARLDVAQLAPEDQRDVTLQLERLRRFTDAAQAHLLVELDESPITELRTGLATSKWLAHRGGLPTGVARRRLIVAKKLAALLPAVDEALCAGRIGFDHAAVFADAVNDRNVEALSVLMADLIDAASGTVFTRWRDDVTALASMLDPDGGHDPADDLARNRLSLSPSDRFMLGRFELSGEHAICVHDTLNAIADELFHQHVRDRDLCPELTIPSRATLLALALEEICRRALAVDRASTRPPRVDATITIHADPDASCHCDDTDHARSMSAAWIHTQLGAAVPASTLPTFLCDPVIYAALLDSLGLPVDMGRAVRLPTAAQRRALRIRDGGCSFPGCDCPPTWTDAHHLLGWQRGNGPTDLSNLALLCRRHHRIAHRSGWTLTLRNDGWTHWTAPNGHSFWGQRHQRQRAGP